MSLSDTQQRLADWIRAPEGVARALEDNHAGTMQDPHVQLESMIRSDETLDAVSRLEIYANAYFFRVLGVLEEDYPALRGLLGEIDFHDLVTSYLWVEPPRQPSLRYAGQRLAGFLASHAAAEAVLARAPWAAELARLEWARVDAFDALDESSLRTDTLAQRDPESFGGLMIRLVPGVEILDFEHPVDTWWRAGVRDEPPTVDGESAAITLLIWRSEERVVHRRLEALEAEALRRVETSTRFGDLCEWAATRVGEAEAPGLAAAWLGRWVADALLYEVEP